MGGEKHWCGKGEVGGSLSESGRGGEGGQGRKEGGGEGEMGEDGEDGKEVKGVTRDKMSVSMDRGS